MQFEIPDELKKFFAPTEIDLVGGIKGHALIEKLPYGTFKDLQEDNMLMLHGNVWHYVTFDPEIDPEDSEEITSEETGEIGDEILNDPLLTGTGE